MGPPSSAHSAFFSSLRLSCVGRQRLARFCGHSPAKTRTEGRWSSKACPFLSTSQGRKAALSLQIE